MGPIFETVGGWLEEQGIEYETRDEQSFSFNYKGENALWPCFVICREEEAQVLFYSVAPVSVAPESRVDVAEMVLRANYGAVLGGFELDVDDGEVRYRTGLDVSDTKLDPVMFRNIVLMNLLMMDTYMPALLAVIHGGVVPSIAVEKTESGELAELKEHSDLVVQETEAEA
jgi:hypothetical protein